MVTCNLRGEKMVKQCVVWRKIETHFKIVPLDENATCKNTKYQCVYCMRVYASNVTRMSVHLLKDCPAPVHVKQEIRDIYTTRAAETSTLSQKHPKLNARWSHVSQHYVKLNAENFPNCKKTKYMCIYCNNRYANNVTRMAQHVMECPHCPAETKNEFYKLSKPKGSTVLSALPPLPPATFDMGSFDQDHEDQFLYAAGFEDGDTMDPISSNSYDDDEMEPFEEKYDITEHLNQGIENIETFHQNGGQSSEMDEEEIKTLIARACYSTSTQLNIFENTYWQKLFNILMPNLRLPTRNELSDKYLNKEYIKINREVENKIKEARNLSIQLIGTSNKQPKSTALILNTPEPVFYDILEPNNIGKTISKILEENNKHVFIPIVFKNCEFNISFPNKHLSGYMCNKYVLKLLVKELIELEVFQEVLTKYKLIAEDVDLKKTVCIRPDTRENVSLTNWRQIYNNLERMIETKINLQKLVKPLKKHQVKSKNFILDDVKFWPEVIVFFKFVKEIVGWMNKIKPESCISSVVECYSVLKELFNELSNETNKTCILECLEKHRNLAISEVHMAASLLDPHFMGRNLSPDEIIDGIEFINKLGKVLPDVTSDKIIFDIAAYRTKQGIWGKEFVWDSLNSEVPVVIWWQSMCSSTELCKIAVNVLNSPPICMSIEGRGKISKEVKKIEYVKYNLRLLSRNNEQSEDSDESD